MKKPVWLHSVVSNHSTNGLVGLNSFSTQVRRAAGFHLRGGLAEDDARASLPERRPFWRKRFPPPLSHLGIHPELGTSKASSSKMLGSYRKCPGVQELMEQVSRTLVNFL